MYQSFTYLLCCNNLFCLFLKATIFVGVRQASRPAQRPRVEGLFLCQGNGSHSR
jgi:hypothetical protein